MSFRDDVLRFAEKVERRQKDIFVGCVNGVRTSVTEGSATTGAPGQPVDTGNLIGSWQETFPSEWVGEVTTGVDYAEPIEEGIGPHGPITLRSGVGGFHSVKLTRAAWQDLVNEVARGVVHD